MRTMLPRGPLRKSAVIGSQLGRLSIDISALSEVRLADSGTIRASVYTFLWSGRPECEHRTSGVAIVLRNSLMKNVSST